MITTIYLLATVVGYSGGGAPDGKGQTCDAIEVCAGGTCPIGMTLVAPPERSNVYTIRSGSGVDVAEDPLTYTPGETVTLWISVVKKYIQRRVNKGVLTCFCDYPARTRIRDSCEPWPHNPPVVVNGVSITSSPCVEPQMESAKYIGFLLYAVDANEKKIGSWELKETPPAVFWTPTDYDCGGQAVMHADAQPKGYVHSLTFRAPEAGAGAITFRALVKQGDTNGGAFYWPTAPAMGAAAASQTPTPGVSGGDLVLTENTNSALQQSWFRGTSPGQSCDAVCAANGGRTCDLDQLKLVASQSSTLKTATAPYFSTINPSVAACGSAFPAITETAESWLFFHADTEGTNTCSADEIDAPSCSAVPAENMFVLRRLCPCKNARRRRLREEEEEEDDEVTKTTTLTPCPHELKKKGIHREQGIAGCPHFTPAAAASVATSAIAKRRLQQSALEENPALLRNAGAAPAVVSTPLILSTLVVVGGGRSLLPLVALLGAISLLPSASAHNWMWNPSSRASQASTAKPCRARRTNIPDVHVNPGQIFEAEWANGHGRNDKPIARQSHFFTIVKAEDADLLNLISHDLLMDYIDSAPADADLLPVEKWHKRHLSWNSSQDGASPSNKGAVNNIEHEKQGKTLSHAFNDPNYIERSSSFKCYRSGRHKNSPSSGEGCYSVEGGLSQWRYQSADLVHDRRVSYKSEKYPWIVSAHRFAALYGYASQADVARFMIDDEPGEYIMHWYWGGYSDCHDIAVLPFGATTTVPDTGESKYGVVGTTQGYSRIDHCAFAGGRLQLMKFGGLADRGNSILHGQCSDNPLKYNSKGQLRSKIRTCYVIPPEGDVNALNETREEARKSCFALCDKVGGCIGLNIVPLLPPPQALFIDESTCTYEQGVCVGAPSGSRAIPFGISNCDKKCFDKEKRPSESMVCYPVAIGTTRSVEEDWTIAVSDPRDEIWYSTCFKKQSFREFRGINTTCMDFVSSKYPDGMCSSLARKRAWRHGDMCISCEAMKSNAANTTMIPVWLPLAPDQCRMCEHKVIAAEAAIATENAAAVVAAAAAAFEDLQAYVFRQNGYALLAFLGVNATVLLVVAIVVAIVAIAVGVSRKRFHSMPDAMKRQFVVDGQNVEMRKQKRKNVPQLPQRRPLSHSAAAIATTPTADLATLSSEEKQLKRRKKQLKKQLSALNEHHATLKAAGQREAANELASTYNALAAEHKEVKKMLEEYSSKTPTSTVRVESVSTCVASAVRPVFVASTVARPLSTDYASSYVVPIESVQLKVQGNPLRPLSPRSQKC